MRHLLLLLSCLLAGCATRGTVAQTSHVDSSGVVSAGVRSASDAQPGVLGPQEIVGVALPLGPFTAKGALIWDGQPWFWTPPAPAAPSAATQAAPCAAPMFVEVEEQYVENVPVQRTRKRQVQVVPVPAPAPRAACPAPPVASTSSCRECVGGCCEVPEVVVVASGR